MGNSQHSRARELEKLRADLIKAARLLDELERRCEARVQTENPADLIPGSEIYPREAETRFAVCISSGIAKLKAKKVSRRTPC